MSGEILRGVLDQNLKVSRWKNYGIRTANLTPGQVSVDNFKCETGTRFLMMNICFIMSTATVASSTISTFPPKVNFQVMSDDLSFSEVPFYSTALAQGLNQNAQLSEYILLHENERFVVTTFSNVNAPETRFFEYTFTGVEYRIV